MCSVLLSKLLSFTENDVSLPMVLFLLPFPSKRLNQKLCMVYLLISLNVISDSIDFSGELHNANEDILHLWFEDWWSPKYLVVLVLGWDIWCWLRSFLNGAQQLETGTEAIFYLSSSEIAEEMFCHCKWEVAIRVCGEASLIRSLPHYEGLRLL